MTRTNRLPLRAGLFALQAAALLLLGFSYNRFVQPHRADAVALAERRAEAAAAGEPLDEALPVYTRGWVREVGPGGFVLDEFGGAALRVAWTGRPPAPGGLALVRGEMGPDGVAVADTSEVDPYYRTKLHISLVAAAAAAVLVLLRYRPDWRAGVVRLRRWTARGPAPDAGGPSGPGSPGEDAPCRIS